MFKLTSFTSIIKPPALRREAAPRAPRCAGGAPGTPDIILIIIIIYIYIYTCMCISIDTYTSLSLYIYIYREREIKYVCRLLLYV